MLQQFASTDTSSHSSALMIFGIICVVLAVFSVAGFWKTFQKAGHAGWLAIIPIVNLYVAIKVAKRPGWWLILYIIPVVNIIVHAVVAVDVAKAFRKSTGYGLLWLWLLPFFGYLMLGFGDVQYTK